MNLRTLPNMVRTEVLMRRSARDELSKLLLRPGMATLDMRALVGGVLSWSESRVDSRDRPSDNEFSGKMLWCRGLVSLDSCSASTS